MAKKKITPDDIAESARQLAESYYYQAFFEDAKVELSIWRPGVFELWGTDEDGSRPQPEFKFSRLVKDALGESRQHGDDAVLPGTLSIAERLNKWADAFEKAAKEFRKAAKERRPA